MSREGVSARPMRAVAVVCATAAMAATLVVSSRARSQTASASHVAAPSPPQGEQAAAPARALPEAPAWIDAERAAGKALVYPPAAERPTPAPVTVVLHGMCGQPQRACGPFVDMATSRGWLVCPRGEDPCGDGSKWRLNGPDDARLIDASVAAVARAHEGEVDASGRVLVGFSLGGIAAESIAERAGGQYAGLVVIASQIHPQAALLKKAGIRRVVFAAGDYDMTSAPLQRDAKNLAASGLPTRFVSLGPYGHGYPPDMAETMREPMEWVARGG